MSYRLVKNNGDTHYSEDICFVSFYKDGTFRKKYLKPAIGRSLLMSPFNKYFTWQTTLITEIIKMSKGYFLFRTQNSLYELFKI